MDAWCVTCVVVILAAVMAARAAEEGRSFSFKTDDQYRQENWTAAGTARGFFGWTDNNGEGIDIEFIADENGYRVIKKKNKVNVLSRQPRTQREFDEFEFGDDDDDGSSYRFAYNTGTSFREEVKRGGVIFGKFGFITADNKLHVTYYSASKKRGFVPIREIRDPSEMAAIYAEPAKPVPLRRLRSLASPPDLLPDIPFPDNRTVLTPTIPVTTSPNRGTVLTSTRRNSGASVKATLSATASPVRQAVLLKSTLSATASPVRQAVLLKSTISVTGLPHRAAAPKATIPKTLPNKGAVQKSTAVRPASVSIPKTNAIGLIPNPLSQRGPLAHSVPRNGKRQFSYNIGRNFHEQSKEADGVSGKYGWRDAQGRVHEIHYVADSQGYKVTSRKLKSNTTNTG